MKRDTREEGDDDSVFRADAGAFWSPSRVIYPARDSFVCVCRSSMYVSTDRVDARLRASSELFWKSPIRPFSIKNPTLELIIE